MSITALVLLIVLVPTAVRAPFGVLAVLSAARGRSAAMDVEAGASRIGALVGARAALASERIATEVVVFGAQIGMSTTQLDRLTGIDIQGALHQARSQVDANGYLQSTPAMHPYVIRLDQLRAQISSGTVSLSKVSTFFGSFVGALNTVAQAELFAVDRQVTLAGTNGEVAQRVLGLSRTMQALTAAIDQTQSATDLVVSGPSPEAVTALISATTRYQGAVAGFGPTLGPGATAAWNTMRRDPAAQKFAGTVQSVTNQGLEGHQGPLGTRPAGAPAAGNLAEFASVVDGGLATTHDLSGVVLAAAAGLRSLSARQAATATDDLVLTVAAVVLILVLVAIGAVIVVRAVIRPLERMGAAAAAIQVGDFDIAPIDTRGPREVSVTARSFNDMVQTIRAVEHHVEALAQERIGEGGMQVTVGGRIGAALHGALGRLQRSMHDAANQRAQLRKLATTDSLTGLANRAVATERIGTEMAEARLSGSSLAILFIDLDRLKEVNDTFGHAAGDRSLVAAASAMRSAIRKGDVVARIGGDEFLVASVFEGDQEVVGALAERIRGAVAAGSATGPMGRIVMTCSVGIAISRAGDPDVEETIRRADAAAYIAKHGGGNAVAWWDPISSGTA